jgi:DinB family protein
MADDWDQQVAIFGESLRILPQLVEGVSADRLRRIPTPNEWSAHVVVCHLVLDEMNTTAVLRLILTEDCPVLPNIDGDNRFCATRFAPLYPDTAIALGVWRALREDNVRLCASLSPDDLERVGRAPWRNGERITFRNYVASRGRHDRAHIEQIRSALLG